MQAVRYVLAILAFACAAETPAAVRKTVAPRRSPVTVVKSVKAVGRPAPPAQTRYRRSPYVGAVVADAQTGRVLFSDQADVEAYPASVTKLMTLLLVLEDIRANRYSLTTRVTATLDVNRCEASWVGLKAGESMTVEDLCMALMVESANDAAIALGVHSAGSFDGFVAKMNARAAALGMTRTKYYNPNGLPPNAKRKYPWKSFNVTTAADQLKLATALVRMPEVMRFTSVKTCDLIRTPKGFRTSVTRRVNQPLATTRLAAGESLVKQMRNHNHVMVQDRLKIFNSDGREAVDGLKTGYIDAGGSSVVLTGTCKGHRVIVVVLGSASAKERDEAARRLMSDALGVYAW